MENYSELPTNENHNFAYNHPGAYLLGEFIKVKFWKKGGGLGLLSDNAPLAFQTKLLKKILKISNSFRVGGLHEEKKILKGIECKKCGNLDNGTFNKVITFDGKYQRQKIAHNLFRMYEGNTVSYIIEKQNYMKFYIKI